METPKVFISYSWHPKENQIRVQQLAERLFSDGVHCVLDIYDLKDGQDKNAFMEQMVNDPSVKKVLLICNKEYAIKANARKGGVGIESTIVSEEIYTNAEQTKFIPIVFEYDENGKPCVPTFVKSRIFIDLSSDEKFASGYDQLLRDIYDKPLHNRPVLGTMPSYLKEDKPAFLPTAHKVESLKKSILSGSPNVETLIQDYLELFLSIVPSYKIKQEDFTSNNFIQKIEEGITQLLPLRDDFISFVQAIVKTKYCTGEVFVDFIESYLQTLVENDINLYEGEDTYTLIFDHFRYFNFDWFLSLCCILVRNERFAVLRDIVKSHYCIIEKSRAAKASEISFIRFQTYNYTLNHYKRLSGNNSRVSILADTMYKNSTLLPFDELVKTDLLLFYVSLIYPGNNLLENYWYPDCSVYNRTVAVLPKIASKRYFEKAKVLFGVNTVEEYKAKIDSVQFPEHIYDGLHMIPKIQHGLSLDDVATIV